MVLGTGFLLLVSLILSTAVAAMSDYIVGVVPVLEAALLVADTIAYATVITLLFALIFKILPDAKIAWRDVWVGAVLTMFVFLIGKAMIGRLPLGAAVTLRPMGPPAHWSCWSSGSITRRRSFTSGQSSRRSTPARYGGASNRPRMPSRSQTTKNSSSTDFARFQRTIWRTADQVEGPGRRGT